MAANLQPVAPADVKGEPEREQQVPDIGRRYLGGTMDAMIVFNDPVTQCQRSFKVNRYIYSDSNIEEVNRLADETQKSLERQFMRHDLMRMEREREAQIQNMKQHKENLIELGKRKASRPHGKGLNQQELNMLDNGDKTMAKAQENLEKMDADIAAAKQACGLS